MLAQSIAITSFPAAQTPVNVAARPLRDRWLSALAILLLGYAVLGKGWAYIGLPPLFIGEAVLLAGLAWFVIWGAWEQIFESGPIYPLLALCAWGLIRTIPYVGQYKVDALRDAVIWGYSAFAIVILAYLRAEPARLAGLLDRYRRFASIFLVAAPIVWAARFLLGDAMPRWPWADVPIIDARAGDILVHLSGILAFWVAMGGRITYRNTFLLAGCAAVLGAYERAGLVAFLVAFAMCLAYRPGHVVLRRLILAAVAAVVLLAVSGIRFEIPAPASAKTREVSFEFVLANFRSMFSDTSVADLDDTKEWRLAWWDEILGYTIHGRYFWTGKGFGVNLADDDGFQVMADDSLRSPHNGHLTMLARAGVPGLALWATVQLSWAWCILRGLLVSRRRGQERWAGVFFFLIVYWAAFMTNAAFDVFMEGPMGGIWFWTIYGTGLFAVWAHRSSPQLLRALPDQPCAS